MKQRIVVLLTVVALMVAMAMPAFAAGPQTPHGTCRVGGPSDNGAHGCAGNVGGFIENQHAKEQGAAQVYQ
jgi:hypothetical protein